MIETEENSGVYYMEQKSNYDAMLLKMEKEFLNYDQSSMVSRLGLKADADYIYVNFAGAPRCV